MGIIGGCNDPTCCASSGYAEEPTFGKNSPIPEEDEDEWSESWWGNDFQPFNGYWEFPCHLCARAFEKAHPEYGPCWPPPEK